MVHLNCLHKQHYITVGFQRIFVYLTSLLLLQACSTTTTVTKTAVHNTIIIPLAPLSSWQTRDFKQKTQYSLHNTPDTSLHAYSSNSASMLYKTLQVNLNKTPYLNWQWQVSNTLDNHNERQRNGDDFPARLYIAIAPKLGSLYPRALTYVWSSNATHLDYWPNPYNRDVIMFSLQSGNQYRQQWISEKRHLKADLEKFFGKKITQIQGIAIMTDTDNTGKKVSAKYRNIFFGSD